MAQTIKKTTTKTVASFKALHDRSVVIPQKIKAAIDKMAVTGGTQHWEYESDFIKLAGVSAADLNAHRDTFKDFVVEARAVGNSRSARRVWFATKAAAKSAVDE